MPVVHRLSKSRFTAGLQCHKQLWWRVHEPDCPELVPSADRKALFETGRRVGELARKYVPGGLLIDVPFADFDGRLAATRAALASGASIIYEAAFSADGVFVAVDILVNEGSGWRVVEVKSSTSVKDEHIPDLAIQVHVLRRSGLSVTGVDMMVLNRACTYPDLSNLFMRQDVTSRVETVISGVAAEVQAQLRMLADATPTVPTGSHCSEPYECPFLARCWPELPPHHVSTLYYLKRRASDFIARGYETIHDLPDGLGLNAPAERQRRAVQTGRLLVEGDLGGALRPFQRPLAFLDFETVQMAIPIWDGCHPYDQVPVQFSCHVERLDGGLDHHAWLPEVPGDPRAALAHRIVAACAGAGAVVAYNAGFEKGRLEALADAVPSQAAALRSIVARLIDLLPPVRDHVYHPDFGGSFSLKSVLPALVPELGYGDLEIAEGQTASRELARLVTGEPTLPPEEFTRKRTALLQYCERDTLAMVRVLSRLRELASPT